MKYNPDIHNRRSIRLKGYDYSREGLYFITICTHNRENLFGKIIDGEMALNTYGEVVKNKWFDLINHVSNIKLHEFVVMPNHIHGIVEIIYEGKSFAEEKKVDLAEGKRAGLEEGKRAGLEPARTGGKKSIDNRKNQPLSEIVRQFKTFSAREINKLRNVKGVSVWHRNYYENIIRNERVYLKVSNYIKNNPKKWNEDKYHDMTT